MDAPELGNLLVQEGVISKDQLGKALKFQKESGSKRLPIILSKLNIVDEKKLVDFFSRNQGLPAVDLEEVILPANLIKRIPKQLILDYQVLPIAFKDDTLTVATFDPYDIEALEKIEMSADCKVRINVARRSQIVKRINDFFERDGLGSLETPPEDTEVRKARKAGKGKDDIDAKVLSEVLLPVLLDKKIVTKEELAKKAKELGLIK
jgi:type IV pilus assembly protein PilB